jgi:hypothetical protein
MPAPRRGGSVPSGAIAGLVLDAGALIGIERNSGPARTALGHFHATRRRVVVPTPVLAQVWRDGRQQARLARYMRVGPDGNGGPEVLPMDGWIARRAGELCGLTGTADVVDAAVVVIARSQGLAVLTGDPKDLLRLDPRLPVITI